MTRRLLALALPLLLALVAVSTAGCMTFGTDCPSSYTLDFEERTVDEIGGELLAEDRLDRTFAERVAHNETVNETTIGEPRLRNGTYASVNGSYYLFTHRTTGERRLDGYDLGIEYDSATTPGAGVAVVAYDDLPAADRQAFDYLHPDRNIGGVRSFSGGRSYAYPNATAETSSLFLDGESVWVEYEGRAYEITVESEASVREMDRRYTATEVAATDDAWQEYVVAAHVRTLTLDTSGQREVVETAIADEYRNCTQTPTGEFGGVVDRLTMGETETIYGDEYVRYSGTYYRVELTHAVV